MKSKLTVVNVVRYDFIDSAGKRIVGQKANVYRPYEGNNPNIHGMELLSIGIEDGCYLSFISSVKSFPCSVEADLMFELTGKVAKPLIVGLKVL